ncbi:MAG: outer membrane protein transport protein [bacterium]|nr:outer membrane protein transport protein [bacterium]MBK8131130.1 outer membrane protein transport protein [bacterium]
MKRIYILLLTLVTTAAFAQDEIPERLLLTSGQHLGTGARALGMGGTYTGVADDYAAIWWNPAGLAQIKRIEVQGTLLRTGYSNDASYFGRAVEGSTDAMRLNNIGVVFPVPVYQGALSFAFGYSQVVDFERRAQVSSGASGQAWDDFDELESGRLGQWAFATAVDVSPNLSVGAALNYWTGSDDYSLLGDYVEAGTPISTEQTLFTELSGWNFNLGGMYRPGQMVRIGAAASTPFSMKLEEDWNFDGDNGYYDYRMTFPWIWRLGASVAPGRWMVAADLEYRDWKSLEFRDSTPFSGLTRAEANRQIRDTYKSTTRLSLGGEYLFPAYGLRGRAGYSMDPSNFKDAGSDADKGVISLGMGVLIDRSMMLDVTWRTASYTENVTDGLTEDIRSSQALFTLSYRM